MYKKIAKTIGFLLLTILLLQQLDGALSLKQRDGIFPMEVFYEQPENSIDVMFYGSSHTYSDINPAVLWEKAGIASFDLAGSLQPLWNTYYYMKESLKYQKPKVMVLELVRAIESRDYIEEARNVTNTFGMKLSQEKYEAVKASTPDKLVPYLLEYPVYHSRYSELSAEDFRPYLGDPNGKTYKGFYPLFETKAFDTMPDMSAVTDSTTLSAKTEDYLRRIIALSKEEGIPLVLMVSPYQGIIESEQRIFNRTKEIAAEEEIPLLDFNLMYEELDLNPAEDMAEFSHLNHRGSTKLSAWLADYLKENYELPDRRGEELYTSWEQNASAWEQLYANQMLREETGWYGFLELLAGNPNYTYLISLDGAYDNGEQPLSEVLTGMGMPEETASWGGVWIHGPGVEKSFPGQGEMGYHLELGTSDLEIRRSAAGTEILFDRENYFKAVNGINILVYDNLTGQFVTAVGFNADSSYDCIL